MEKPQWVLDFGPKKHTDLIEFDCSDCSKHIVTEYRSVVRRKTLYDMPLCKTCSAARNGGSIQKARKAFQDKHGTDNPFKLKRYQDKAKATNLEKYGAVNHKQADLLKKFNVETEEQAAQKVIEYLEKTGLFCNHSQVTEHFQTVGVVLTRLLNKYGRKDLLLLERSTSQGEQDLATFVTSIESNIQTNIRSIISPSELDIYLPSQKIAIEYNGLYWHSITIKEQKAAHLLKRQWCEKKGIRLIQINEDEWLQKRLIVESMLKHILGKSEYNLGARETTRGSVSLQDAEKFLEENHLMGKSSRGCSYWGLYYKDILVSLLAYKAHKNGVDIARFCNKLNHNIIGGLSKLLAPLEKKYDFIQSYVDLRYGNGKSLEKLGFEKESEFLSWKWTDYQNTFNRLYCRANMDDRCLSEREYAEEMKLVRIYDAGQAKYIKKKGR